MVTLRDGKRLLVIGIQVPRGGAGNVVGKGNMWGKTVPAAQLSNSDFLLQVEVFAAIN